MSTLAQTLRDEIRRQARREITAELQTLRRQCAQHWPLRTEPKRHIAGRAHASVRSWSGGHRGCSRRSQLGNIDQWLWRSARRRTQQRCQQVSSKAGNGVSWSPAWRILIVVTLNDPIPPHDADNAEWTPTRGLLRALAWGAATSAVLIGLTGTAAYFVPLLTLATLLRTVLAFAIAWILFGVVQTAAGMTGAALSALAVALTIIVLLSHHVVFAIHGVPTDRGVEIGWQWLYPDALGLVNGIPLIGVAFCAALRHDGGADGGTIAQILTMGVWGSRR